MDGTYLMGTDIGTHGTKTVLVSPEGEVLGSGQADYEVEQPEPSWAQQWPDVWVEATYDSIRQAIDDADVDPAEVRGISISSLYGGAGVPIDAEGEPLYPCLIWMDRRATDQVEWVKENVDLDELFEITGNYVDSYFGYTKILWLKENEPEVFEQTENFVPPNNYVEYVMTDELAVDYSSAGNIGGVFDIDALEWSEEACEMLGITTEKFPDRLVPSEEIVGEMTAEAAEKSGLEEGTPVLAGGVDAPMATLAAGAFEGGDNVSMMGTSTCWGTIHSGDGFSEKLVSMPHVADSEEKVYTFGGSATTGGLIEWFKDEFGGPEEQAGELADIDPFELLNMKAEEIPAGSEGLIALPYFKGERSPIWDPEARGTFMGLTLYHEKAHMYRALMEAGGYSLLHNVEVVENLGLPLNDETHVVGGVSNSELWMEILADVTGREMIVPAGGVGAPLGDALLVGVGTGLIEDYDAITDWTATGEVYTPDADTHETYSEYYEIYKSLYQNAKEDMHRLARL
ncbi:FGGY-family carbohydrate kinase [Halorhabdus amylolytica]|uniref:FGGY-family carbohydrate kinase n=1 Tax=Halorhabdus amylolytica TaxID=2559573 RepID=UPI0010AA3FB6|nr:FGGY-family carbohydrate kinase [Halorhabdus amylolytica]